MRLPKTSATRWLCIGIALICGLALLLPAAFSPPSARAATVVVDDFSTSQADLEVYPDPEFVSPDKDVSSSVSGAGILGGERDLRAQAIIEQLDPENRGLFAGVANSRLEASSQTLARGTITAQWDGTDDDPVNLDPTGLGGVDLTGGGTDDAFLLKVSQDTSDTSGLTITVYTDADNSSSFDLNHLHTTSTVDYIIAFDEFTAAGGSGADFTDVGAITLSFSYHGAGGIGPYIDVFQTTQFDRQPPQTTVFLSGTAGDNGWYTSAVQVTLNATDDFSGVADTFYSLDGDSFQTYSAPFTISTDGQHIIRFYSTDLVSNTEASKTITVTIDQTAPSITGSALPAANANGWNNSDVTVSFTCTDTQGGSGVDTDSVTPPVPLNAEGANQSAGGDCSDLAGNSASTTVSNINIDMTAPVITVETIQTADGQAFGPAPAVWTNQDVTVTFTCAEVGAVQSGIDEDSVAGVTLEADGANQTATNTGTCTDLAGNSATAASVFGINIDQTAPSAAAGDAYQVDEGGSIALDGSGSTDGLSGIASTAWALDGDNQFSDADPSPFAGLDGPATIAVALQVTDNAGNVTTMGTMVTVNNLPPEIHVVTNDGPPTSGSTVNVTVDTTDPAGLLDPLSYEFDCDNDLAYEVGPQSDNSAACDIGVQEGGIIVNVRVTDGDGGEALGSTMISVPTEMCANRYTGLLRYDTGCRDYEQTVVLSVESPVSICVNNYTGTLRHLQRGGCSASETWLSLPDDGPLAVCVSGYTQVMRAVDDIASCQPFETGHIIGNSSGGSPGPITTR